MIWNKNLETGIALIDDEHKELFRMIDDLVDAKQPDRIRKAINFLSDYIKIHFRDEEKLHADSKYPKAIIHKGYHSGYIRAFTTMKNKLEQEGENLQNKMAVTKNVMDWLKNHILVHDLEFARYYKQKVSQS